MRIGHTFHHRKLGEVQVYGIKTEDTWKDHVSPTAKIQALRVCDTNNSLMHILTPPSFEDFSGWTPDTI